MKRYIPLFAAAALAAGSTLAIAQSTQPADAAKTDATTRPTSKEAMQSQMDLQKNKPSKKMTDAEKAAAKSRPTSQDAMQSQMDLQKNKPSKPVDKNAKAAPRPNASKMTPEERAAFRKDVVKDAKP